MAQLKDDPAAFYAALDDLERALIDNVARANRMRERIAELREARGSGRPLRELVPAQEPPIIVRMLSESARVLDEYGSQVRRLEAQVLHQEGMTMEQIATLFGVSRQRVSALLRP
jgi:DNA-directed RNA polymerase sigma subunit (sigma70/sigma32)